LKLSAAPSWVHFAAYSLPELRSAALSALNMYKPQLVPCACKGRLSVLDRRELTLYFVHKEASMHAGMIKVPVWFDGEYHLL
jgi:hypothetical protein